MFLLEVLAVFTGIVYIWLAASENRWCWVWGGFNAILSVVLFYFSKLYAESFLYIYYAFAAAYGWWSWGASSSETLKVSSWRPKWHLVAIAICTLLSFALGLSLRHFTDAKMPIVDAHTTIFSFFATYLTTKKIIESWLYWVVVDSVTIYLYWSRALPIYALLSLVYTLMSVRGYLNWRRSLLAAQ